VRHNDGDTDGFFFYIVLKLLMLQEESNIKKHSPNLVTHRNRLRGDASSAIRYASFPWEVRGLKGK